MPAKFPPPAASQQHSTSLQMLFPLPFSPFEFYYWSDDNVDYPTTYPVELSFSGRLDRAALRRALGQALSRHPLVGARVDDSGPKLPRWNAGPEEPPEIDWADLSQPIEGRAVAYIDLRRESGLRVWVRESADVSRVVLQFHHACCDGIGMFQFLEDWLACYASAVDSSAPCGSRSWTPSGLATAAALRPTTRRGHRSARPCATCSVVAGVWGDIMLSRPARLAAPSRTAGEKPAESEGVGLDLHTNTFTTDETRALREAARALGVTTNELLARDVLQVVRGWNRLHGGAGARLRLNVPVNVREPSDATMPATNRIGFAFVAPSKRDYRDPRRLLESVRRQMQRVKEWKLGLYFLGGLEFAVPLSAAGTLGAAAQGGLRHDRLQQPGTHLRPQPAGPRRRALGLRQRGARADRLRATAAAADAGRARGLRICRGAIAHAALRPAFFHANRLPDAAWRPGGPGPRNGARGLGIERPWDCGICVFAYG